MLDRGAIARTAGNAHDPGLLAVRSREQGVDERAALASSATTELQAREPQLITTVERAEKTETHGRIAAVTIVGPENIARHRDRFDASAARIFLHEVAVNERALE